MKPGLFSYHAPSDVRQALNLLEELGEEDATCLAGGQSLVPLMNMRLARPEHLIDLNGLEELRGIERDGHEWRLGALTRHAEIEDSETLRNEVPILPYVAGHIGYRAVRNRGTLGGAICHADPVAEWPLVMRLLDAQFDVSGVDGERTLSASDFFVSVFTSCLQPGEILTSVRFRLPEPRWRWGFSEFARKVGDYATVAAGVIIVLDGDEVVDARMALSGVATTPYRATTAEAELLGADLSDAKVRQRAAEAAADAVTPMSDSHGSSDFRKQLTRSEVANALAKASSARMIGV